MHPEPRALLTALFNKAVEAADPYAAIIRHLPSPPRGQTIVIGAGKAAIQMAAAFERAWGRPVEGVVVARHGPVAHHGAIQILQSAHPVPDAAGLEASAVLLERVSGLTKDDLVIALVSGGGSALLPASPAGFGLTDEIALNEALLAMADKIRAGTVWVNTYRAVSYLAPFGGTKMSGIGRESGLAAIDEYLQTKSVWINLAEGIANPFVIR